MKQPRLAVFGKPGLCCVIHLSRYRAAINEKRMRGIRLSLKFEATPKRFSLFSEEWNFSVVFLVYIDEVVIG